MLTNNSQKFQAIWNIKEPSLAPGAIKLAIDFAMLKAASYASLQAGPTNIWRDAFD